MMRTENRSTNLRDIESNFGQGKRTQAQAVDSLQGARWKVIGKMGSPGVSEPVVDILMGGDLGSEAGRESEYSFFE